MDNKRLFGMICFLQREMDRRNCAALSSFGITGVKLHALVFIHVNAVSGKSVCQRDIERELNLRASSVSSMLADLAERGYITRAYADGDGRTKFIGLTQKGEQLCLKNRELMDKCDAIIQNALSEDEVEQFAALLTKISGFIKSRA